MNVRAPDHEFEAEHGLPEPLPGGERILWQGSPRWSDLLTTLFHLDVVALWFAVLALLRASDALQSTDGLPGVAHAVHAVAPLAAMALASIGVFALLAMALARTTVYTLTDRRVVMRIGIVLTITFNLPLTRIDSVGLRQRRDGCGDLTLSLNRDDRIAWLHLWPHVRPWRVRQPEPMLRGIAQAEEVGRRLARALQASGAQAAPAAAGQTAVGQAGRPSNAGGRESGPVPSGAGSRPLAI